MKPNRSQRRKMAKAEAEQHKPKYSLVDVQKAMNIALEMKKLSKGHLYSKTLKDRCVFCGASMKARKQCPYWLFTFMDRIQTVIINPHFFSDSEIQALWVRVEDEYKEIQFPVNMHLR